MSDFSNSLKFTVIRTEKHSFTSSDGKEIEYVDSLILSDSGKLYIVRDKSANQDWQSGEDRTENLFQNGKVTPLKVPVLKIDRES